MKKVAIAAVMMVWAAAGFACSAYSWTEDSPVTNEPVASANGRYLAVVRRHAGIADFRSVRAGDYFTDDEKPAPAEVVVATYRAGQQPELIAEFAVPADIGYQVFVSDSGRYIVFAQPLTTGCGRTPIAEDAPLVAIYSTTGTPRARLHARDFFYDYDRERLSRENFGVDFALRSDEKDSEQFVITAAPRGHEISEHIDLASGVLLDRQNLNLPEARAFVTPVGTEARREYKPASPDCAAMFAEPDLVHLASARMYAQANWAPEPEFPRVAEKAGVRGVVFVEVVVESGGVLCARSSNLAFGVDTAALETVKKWRFAPLLIKGRMVRFAGELLFHFEDVQPYQRRM